MVLCASLCARVLSLGTGLAVVVIAGSRAPALLLIASLRLLLLLLLLGMLLLDSIITTSTATTSSARRLMNVVLDWRQHLPGGVRGHSLEVNQVLKHIGSYAEGMCVFSLHVCFDSRKKTTC